MRHPNLYFLARDYCVPLPAGHSAQLARQLTFHDLKSSLELRHAGVARHQVARCRLPFDFKSAVGHDVHCQTCERSRDPMRDSFRSRQVAGIDGLTQASDIFRLRRQEKRDEIPEKIGISPDPVLKLVELDKYFSCVDRSVSHLGRFACCNWAYTQSIQLE